MTSSPAGSDLVVPLAGLSFHVWYATTHLAEGVERCLAVRGHVHDGVALPDRARYWLRIGELGMFTMRQDCYDAALHAADLYRTLGDDGLRYDALLCAAAMGQRLASVADMEALIEEAAPLERADWPARQRARLPFARHRLYQSLGRMEEALACAQQQADINREGGQWVWAQIAMVNVASAEIALNRPAAALERVRDAIAALKALGAESTAGHLYLNAAWALTTLGRPDEALVEVRAAYPLLRQEGDEHRLFWELAYIAALQGRLTAAARISGRDDAVHARVYAVQGRTANSLDQLLEAGLPAEELARLRAEGAAMRDDDVFRLGFGDEGRARPAVADTRNAVNAAVVPPFGGSTPAPGPDRR